MLKICRRILPSQNRFGDMLHYFKSMPVQSKGLRKKKLVPALNQLRNVKLNFGLRASMLKLCCYVMPYKSYFDKIKCKMAGAHANCRSYLMQNGMKIPNDDHT